MDLTLTRTINEMDGIFGELRSTKELVAYTCEHAYLNEDGNTYSPKLPNGIYTCKRSMHKLHGMTQDFETFEVENVLGHTGILIHWGNWGSDSDGCILVGSGMAPYKDGHMITNSKVEFGLFMNLQKGIDSFQLTVY